MSTESTIKEPTLPPSTDLKSILDHTRGQFQYHATQRLNTIRYFFVAYAIFVAAYVNAGRSSVNESYLQLAISATAVVISILFWLLEVRNRQLVKINEQGLEEIERLVAQQFNYAHFRMIEGSEMPGSFIKYSKMVAVLYAWFTIIALIAFGHDLLRVVKCH